MRKVITILFVFAALFSAQALGAPKTSATVAVTPNPAVTDSSVLTSGCGYEPGQIVVIRINTIGFTSVVDSAGCFEEPHFAPSSPGTYPVTVYRWVVNHPYSKSLLLAETTLSVV